jgi:ABC-2 type transport system permease protein
MRNIFIIARREYLERVRSRSFLIMTFLIPALMFGVTVVPSLIGSRSAGGNKKIVVAAAAQQTGDNLREQVLTLNKTTPDTNVSPGQRSPLTATRYEVTVQTDVSDAARKSLTEQVAKKSLDGVIWASDDAVSSRKVDFITRDVSSFMDNATLERAVGQALRRQSLKGKGLTDQDIESALKPVDLTSVSPYGKDTPNPQVVFFTAFGMVMVMYMTVMLYGMNVMRAVLEEKTSRVMEVMLSIATSGEMMAGKIIGVGAVGLTQVTIWAAVAGGFPLFMAGASGLLKGVLSVKLIFFFGVFFLLGFALYSTMCAAVGAMVNSEQEAQQLQFLIVMPLILSVVILVNVIQYPGSALAFWASIFPLTAPLIMFTRIALQTPVWWQIALSISLMVLTVWGLAFLCARIYRVGVLMYGKKPTFPEIIKWIKYA